MTGFSGGGSLTWNMILGHPEMLAAAAPACANYVAFLALSKDPSREALPITAFQTENDAYRRDLEMQFQAARKSARPGATRT